MVGVGRELLCFHSGEASVRLLSLSLGHRTCLSLLSPCVLLILSLLSPQLECGSPPLVGGSTPGGGPPPSSRWDVVGVEGSTACGDCIDREGTRETGSSTLDGLVDEGGKAVLREKDRCRPEASLREWRSVGGLRREEEAGGATPPRVVSGVHQGMVGEREGGVTGVVGGDGSGCTGKEEAEDGGVIAVE